YRILGSVQDAEDVLQETLLAAWRGLSRFEERASMRTWLYTIATNRCLNALRDNRRRLDSDVRLNLPEPTRRVEPLWLQPYPDALLDELPDAAPGPEARYETREAVALAFVAGLQRLPPRQRAVLVLRDVLGYPAAEAATMLDISDVAVNSALQRARATLAAQVSTGRDVAPAPRSAQEREVASRFADAFEAADAERLVAVLTGDALLTMPPEPLEYEGHAAIANFFRTRSWWGTEPVRLLPTRANFQPAFGYYLPDPSRFCARQQHAPDGAGPDVPIMQAHGLVVLTLAGDKVCAITRFGDSSVLPHFGLPRTLGD
ncbi:MAG: RNA polymerase subunit sigma-70, partial [Actinobacteria bacterium]|nr:RNA polymerase subunit sigma-70 [Actinomycetota bacterium]